MPPSFVHRPLEIIRPDFDSNLTDLIIELNFLRRKTLSGTTPPAIFFQLKKLFHAFESLGSAHIEGNNTTISEYLAGRSDISSAHRRVGIAEVKNIEDVLEFIDEHAKDVPFNKMFLRELHKRVVKDLPLPSAGGEGSFTPGEFRLGNVQITNVEHLPPDAASLDFYLDELLDFINRDYGEKYDLLKIAIAHHRFVWIHPFDNGNGRVVRLLTYAMLIRAGFNVEIGGRILNPTAVFCNDRKVYYQKLAGADTGNSAEMVAWCEYVLGGLKDETEKIDKLCDYNFLKEKILFPALKKSLATNVLTKIEGEMLKIAIEKGVFRAPDFSELFEGKAKSEVSRKIRNLIKSRLVAPLKRGGRHYVLTFENRAIWAPVVDCLIAQGFLPESLK